MKSLFKYMLLTIVLIWILLWFNQKLDVYKIKSNNKILILTTTRSGSSFLGEIFNSQNNVFYLFEPLWHLNNFGKEYVRILKNLFACKITVLRKYLTQNFFFKRNYSKALCKPDRTCSYSLKGDQKYACEGLKCKPLDLDDASVYCREFDTVVIKTVRIRNKTQALQLINSDVKIIHLVRDPRGSFNSKIKTFDRNYNFREISKICQDDVDIYKTLADKFGRYYVLRYEDLVLNPHKELINLFSFCKLPFDEDVIKTVNKLMTKDQSGPYSIGKARPNVWKKELSEFKVLTIEKACLSYMETFNFFP
ncbi:hypothetical protein LCDVSa149L [Lymphocystis disease virus 3]|uniref:Sulfotransferase domain-containing protein n=1 Tax=Lymphocystis disease virus 3 TaxID=2560566 RepID=A0A1B2RW60_9VIRU|nr:hypothetical protein BZK12_gp149 [Lymphocystis disease virus Sa]AOC55233.1 hypothetical protein LCDVSa149L [Lymphocystis disease virus 3]